jgi:hypothetical protein
MMINVPMHQHEKPPVHSRAFKIRCRKMRRVQPLPPSSSLKHLIQKTYQHQSVLSSSPLKVHFKWFRILFTSGCHGWRAVSFGYSLNELGMMADSTGVFGF